MGTEGVICPSPSLRVHPPTAWLPPLSILCAQPCLLLPHVLSQAAHSRPGLLHLPLSSRPDSPGPPPSHSLFCSPDPEGLRADLPSRASAQQPGKAGTYTVVLHTHTDSHMDTHTLCTHGHTLHAHRYTRSLYRHTHIHANTLYTYTHIHALHIQTHAYTQSIYTQGHTNTHGTHKNTNTYMDRHIDIYTENYIHPHMHTHRHTYTHT